MNARDRDFAISCTLSQFQGNCDAIFTVVRRVAVAVKDHDQDQNHEDAAIVDVDLVLEESPGPEKDVDPVDIKTIRKKISFF